MAKQPVYYMQTDPKWANMDYSAKGEHTTVGKSACGPTSAAMLVATLKDKSVTPVEAVKWSLAHGYKALNQGTYYTYFEPYFKQYGIKCTRITSASIYHNRSAAQHKTALQALKDGHYVIACMGKGIWTKSGHFLVAWKTDGNKVWINDPNSKASNRTCNTVANWQYEVKQYYIIEVPNAKEEDDEVVESRKVNLLGKETTVKGILKDGSNYLGCDSFKQMGLTVTSKGSEPVISIGKVSVKIDGKIKEIDGFNGNGTNYASVRQIAETLGKKVSWDGKNIVIE